MIDTETAGLLEIVVFVGEKTTSSKLMAHDLSNVLDAVERCRGIPVEMRDELLPV